MKAILMSIRPEWVAKILNGEKTIEVRKRFPSDYVGWVYIYVTKGKPLFICKDSKGIVVKLHDSKKNVLEQLCVNGKVVGRFWCDKVEEISKIIMYNRPYDLFETETLQPTELLKQSCLRATEMTKYFMLSNLPKESAAINITKVEPFDKPKELNEFKTHLGCNKSINCMFCKYNVFKECTKPRYLTRAPQNYCYIEI